MGNYPEINTFKILIATDIHLGFMEKDGIRGNDSFIAFEEILRTAQKESVDLVLLGGDLFHENKPSRQSRVKCLKLLRHYCMGEKPISVECVSDQSINFGHYKGEPIVNYEDPNLNIAIPVFSIHGNHDDPCGADQLCALDELCTSGLVNFFGKCTDLKEIIINPILLRKGTSKLALYGIGSIKDSRLYRLFKEHKVSMLRPKESTNEWFNLFCIHQNRAARGNTDFIPDHFLNSFLDLVLWGHEHDCRITPEKGGKEGDFYITQPGSSVVTSLCAGEALPKHIGLLYIHEKEFRLESIPLKTVRPFVYRDLMLSQCDLDLNVLKPSEVVESYLATVVEDMISDASKQISGDSKQPSLPLLRLRVEYSDENQLFNLTYFSQSYIDRVANCDSLLLMKKEKKKREVGKSEDLVPEDISETRIDTLLEEYFSRTASLQLLSLKGITDAIQKFVEKEETDAIASIAEHQINKITKHLESCQDLTEDHIEMEVEKFHKNRQCGPDLDYDQVVKGQYGTPIEQLDLLDDSDILDADLDITSSSKSGRARGRGRARSATGRATRRASQTRSKRGITSYLS